jgi:hypothetical protein
VAGDFIAVVAVLPCIDALAPLFLAQMTASAFAGMSSIEHLPGDASRRAQRK